MKEANPNNSNDILFRHDDKVSNKVYCKEGFISDLDFLIQQDEQEHYRARIKELSFVLPMLLSLRILYDILVVIGI